MSKPGSLSVPGWEVTKGSRSRTAKLDESKVREIKVMLRDGKTPKEIAPLFGVSKQVIYDIRADRKWRHVEIDEN